MTFWDELPNPFFALAPMEEVTDIVFRKTVARAGRPDVFFTEFTNAASYCSDKGRFSTEGRLKHDDTEQPIVAQIWGTNPEHFRIMARDLREQGFSGIDINMGCPAKDVYKIGAGSGMIGNTELAGRVIAATKEAGLPVSVKTRLGKSRLDEWRPWVGFLLQQDLANLTIHLRTRKEMSKVGAHYELIDDICALRNQLAPQTKITVNGDIRDKTHGLQLKVKHPQVDGFMIGRSVFANPFCFNNAAEHPLADYIDLFRYQLDQYDKYRIINAQATRKFDPLKHFFKIYIKGFDGAAELRAQLYGCTTTDQVRDILDKSFD